MLNVPLPRLPRLLGNLHNLSASNSVYPACLPLDFPMQGKKYASVTGSISQVVPIDTNLLINFVGPQATFDEYCIVGATFEVTVLDNFRTGGTAPLGWLAALIDEESSGAPTNASLGRPHCELMLNSTSGQMRTVKISWKPQDFTDLTWLPTTNTSQPRAWLKLYANNTYTFTASDQTTGVAVTGSLALCFRGLST